MKECTTCNKIKESSDFHKDSRRKDGLQCKCKECKKEWSANRYKNKKDHITKVNKEWKSKNKERVNVNAKKWAKNNPEKIKVNRKNTYEKYKEEYKQRCVDWKQNNKEKVADYNKKWIEDNRGTKNHLSNKRRANKLRATPEWADLNKIQEVYIKSKELSEVLGIKLEVDHIIPLQGKNVCGLHIWENLQLLEESINRSKSNKTTA